MGYFRPVASFNIGKKGEYAERTFFTEQAAGVGAGGPVARSGAAAATAARAAAPTGSAAGAPTA